MSLVHSSRLSFHRTKRLRILVGSRRWECNRRCATNTETSAVKTSCGCELQRAGSGVCSLLSKAARGCIQMCWPRRSYCGHRSKAGCLSANQGMPVQVRLTAPFTVQYAAGASTRSRASKTLRVRGSTGTPRHCVSFSNNCGVAKWEGSGLISRQ